MEEEKKQNNPAGGDRQKKFQKKKGYFIEPVAPDRNKNGNPAAGAPERKGQPGGGKPKNSPQRQDRPQGAGQPSGKPADGNPQNNHSRNRNRKPAPAQNPQAPQNAKAPESGSKNDRRPASAQNESPRSDEQRRGNRRRHRSEGRQAQELHAAREAAEEILAARKAPENRQSAPLRGNDRLSAKPLKEDKSTLFPELTEVAEEATYDISEISSSIYDDSPVTPKEEPVNDNSPRKEVVGIRFKSSGKVYYFDPCGKIFSRGSHAIVETARGQEYGEVAMGNRMIRQSEIIPPLRPVLRAATEADKLHHRENKEREDDAFKVCNEKILAHKLDMKLIDAQYTFDNSKLLFYFTSSGRVDFRDLVKDLASCFHTRIELRQIGIRDEAKLIGGLGMCGRPLCCSLFLSDFGQVSIKMAKEQNLSLNSAKISGICGRLMCCLKYEHETYAQEIRLTPPVDSVVRTPDGDGVVTETNPLAGTIKVRLNDSSDPATKVYHRDNVEVLQRKQSPKPQNPPKKGN